MRTIATYNMGLNGCNVELKLLTNAKNKDSGEYIVIDTQGNEHEVGMWGRIKDNNRYLYVGWSYNQLSKGNKKYKYYSRQDLMYQLILRYLYENEIND